MRDLQALTGSIIGAAIDVHRALGPGLLESAYRSCLAFELADRGWRVESERQLPLIYRGQPMGVGYRLDLLVEDTVIVEVKAVHRFEPVHTAQLISYLRLTDRHLGLLFNFNVKWLASQGLRRVVREFPDDWAAPRGRY
jgi:GxxExxY protein